MQNTTAVRLLVIHAETAVHSAGGGAYARFCAGAVQEAFGAAVIAPPAWTTRLPHAGTLLARYLWSRCVRLPRNALVYSPTHRALPAAGNQVVTVLDLIPLHCPDRQLLQQLYFRRVLPSVLRRCRAIITLSEALKVELSERFGIAQQRVHVVPPGVDTAVFRPAPAAREAEPFLLVAGAWLPHKNVQEVIAAAALWAPRYRLTVISVPGPYRRQLEDLARRAGLGRRIEFVGPQPQPQLVSLYQRCAGLLYPSLDEGFGLPPLEALACGRPVVAADIAAVRESCGDAAIYVQPGDERSWAQALAALADTAALAPRLTAGAQRAAHYSWEHTRRRLLEALAAVEPRLTAQR